MSATLEVKHKVVCKYFAMERHVFVPCARQL